MSEQISAAIAEEVEDSHAGKYLTFYLAEEEYGIEILKVREIFGMMSITPVPHTPAHICGILNLRGKVIPVTELRLKFGMETIERTEETCIIVVQAQEEEMGIIVDRVSEVLDIPGSDIQDTPAFGTKVTTEYLLGIGNTEGNVRLLLDIDRVVSEQDVEDMLALTQPGGNAPAVMA